MDENPMNILQNIWEEETVKAYLDGSGSILCSHLFFRELPEMVWYSKVTKGEHPKEEVKAEGRLHSPWHSRLSGY